jgi:uncharacterized protein
MSEDLGDLLPPKKHIYYTNGLTLIIGALIILTAWNISDRPWLVLGLQWPEVNSVVIYAVIFLVIFYVGDLLYGMISNDKLQQIETMSFVVPLNKSDYKHYIFLAFAAGICEEIVFRGFLINYLLQLDPYIYHVQYIAIAIPALVFAVSHLYQGLWAVFKIFIVAVLLAIIFWYSKSLLIVVILHVLVDLVSGLVAWLSSQKEWENNC